MTFVLFLPEHLCGHLSHNNIRHHANCLHGCLHWYWQLDTFNRLTLIHVDRQHYFFSVLHLASILHVMFSKNSFTLSLSQRVGSGCCASASPSNVNQLNSLRALYVQLQSRASLHFQPLLPVYRSKCLCKAQHLPDVVRKVLYLNDSTCHTQVLDQC